MPWPIGDKPHAPLGRGEGIPDGKAGWYDIAPNQEES